MNVSTCTHICIHPRHPESPNPSKRKIPLFKSHPFLGSSLYFSETYHIQIIRKFLTPIHHLENWASTASNVFSFGFRWHSEPEKATTQRSTVCIFGGPFLAGKKLNLNLPRGTNIYGIFMHFPQKSWIIKNIHIYTYYILYTNIQLNTNTKTKIWNIRFSFTCIRSSSPPTRNIQ